MSIQVMLKINGARFTIRVPKFEDKYSKQIEDYFKYEDHIK